MDETTQSEMLKVRGQVLNSIFPFKSKNLAYGEENQQISSRHFFPSVTEKSLLKLS